MAARSVDVSASEIDQFKENTVPQKTKEATKFGVKLFKGMFVSVTIRRYSRRLIVKYKHKLSPEF